MYEALSRSDKCIFNVMYVYGWHYWQIVSHILLVLGNGYDWNDGWPESEIESMSLRKVKAYAEERRYDFPTAAFREYLLKDYPAWKEYCKSHLYIAPGYYETLPKWEWTPVLCNDVSDEWLRIADELRFYMEYTFPTRLFPEKIANPFDDMIEALKAKVRGPLG